MRRRRRSSISWASRSPGGGWGTASVIASAAGADDRRAASCGKMYWAPERLLADFLGRASSTIAPLVAPVVSGHNRGLARRVHPPALETVNRIAAHSAGAAGAMKRGEADKFPGSSSVSRVRDCQRRRAQPVRMALVQDCAGAWLRRSSGDKPKSGPLKEQGNRANSRPLGPRVIQNRAFKNAQDQRRSTRPGGGFPGRAAVADIWITRFPSSGSSATPEQRKTHLPHTQETRKPQGSLRGFPARVANCTRDSFPHAEGQPEASPSGHRLGPWGQTSPQPVESNGCCARTSWTGYGWGSGIRTVQSPA